MFTLLLDEPGVFKATETDRPVPEALEAGEVLVRVQHVGLCGTDIHAFKGDQPFFNYPRILGHELGVVVEALGDGVTTVDVGDKCSVEPYLAEPVDRAYARGKTNCSASTKCLGVHVDGGMREAIILPERLLHPSKKLTTQTLALVEPLCIGHHAVERAQLLGDELVAVIGLGPIGLAAVQFALLSGAKVVGVDMSPDRLSRALELYPALETLQVEQGQTVLEAWKAVGELPEVVLECTGSKPSMENSIGLPGHGGRIVLVGIYNGNLSFFDPDLHKRELSILSSRNATAKNFRSVIQLIESGYVDVDAWVTHRCAAREFIEELPKWLSPSSGLLKGVIDFS